MARPGVLPSGVVTFLFTDIEGSTRRWEADPEVMRAALADHDDVLRSATEAQGGRVFKHTGDGVCVVFTSPRAAVKAAVAAQQALDLPVRMGISTGEAELRGTDYFGAVLNRAARVMAAGHGGQILLDGLTAGLLRGVDLVDLGSRRLRDITDPVQVFQVRAPGLRAGFPPLLALDTPQGNLRPAASRLIGRDAELEDIAIAVREHRVVTLTGVGGVGKTRLALGVAVQLAEEFPDGVWVLELANVTDATAVPDAVAAVLGITQQPGKSVAESIAAAMEGRVRLLVFDNCEHVLDAAADLIETVLAHSATVRILATSREGLGVADEQVWPVSSLDHSGGIDSAAATLFVERAQAVAPRFSLTNSVEAEAAVDICRRLDGLPLAIELAASRMASMSAPEVRDRLDDRFRLLVGSRRSLSRHQTLRHAVAWSYDLLSADEKVLLDRCSVFTGGFDLRSACAVADSGDEYAVLDHLDALVRKSLLVADRSSGHTRYSMLETIRQFAEDQLVASGEATEARTRHAHYFAGQETDILALWDSPRQREAYDWFDAELPNLRTAFRWAAEQGDLDTAAAIATYAGLVGFLVENYELIAWVEELIQPARAVHHPRLQFLYQIASVCYMTGHLEASISYVEELAALIRDSYDDVPFGLAGLAGGVYLMIGQPERCVEWCRAHLGRERNANALTRTALVHALKMAGSDKEALVAADGLIEAAEATGNPWVLSYSLLSYGAAHRDVDPASALDALRRGLWVTRESGNRFNESHMAHALAGLEAEHGDPLAALDYIALALRHYRDAGSIAFIHSPLASLATILNRLGRPVPASTIAGFAALSFIAVAAFPEVKTTITHLRDVLGESTYESLAHKGETMTTAAMATYALDQIDQARAELTAVSK